MVQCNVCGEYLTEGKLIHTKQECIEFVNTVVCPSCKFRDNCYNTNNYSDCLNKEFQKKE